MAGETKSNGQKDRLDRFYTRNEIVLKCLENLDLSKYTQIIEPSAGDGAFSKLIPNCLAYDIAPAAENIHQANWLQLDKSQFDKTSLVIGNPPFGQQNSLAINFINESAKFAQTIAFILPLSFKKTSVQQRVDKHFHLMKTIDLPMEAFTFEGQIYSVPCIFQIWERSNVERIDPRLKTTSSLFAFTSKANADFRIQRVGGNAGKASSNLDYSEQSNYFIKNLTNLSNDEFIEKINQITYPSVSWTVGPKSLSKGELVECIEELFS